MKAVYTADNPMQAYAVKNFLEAEGIPAVVVGEGMFPLRGAGASFSGDSLPQVCVTNEEDAPRALELLRECRALTQEPAAYTNRAWVRWAVLCFFALCLLVLVLALVLRPR